ncbi:MAG: hypothetical protein MUC65_06370 [Pontiellaceae bacterium]|jgi:hypothetical protein|nr:hypothetical protein [Pontiellaceae bacterium]
MEEERYKIMGNKIIFRKSKYSNLSKTETGYASNTRYDTMEVCKLRAANNRIVPYRQLELKNLGIPAITEVNLGPKNRTPRNVVKEFLKSKGFSDVEVQHSELPYR